MVDAAVSMDPGAMAEVASTTLSPFSRTEAEYGENIEKGDLDPTLGEVVEDPSLLLGLQGEVAAGLSSLATGKVGPKTWAEQNPETVKDAEASGKGAENAYDDYLFGESSAEAPLVNPVDAPAGGNVIEHAANIAGAVPEMIGSYVSSGQEGTLGPFLGRAARQTISDPLIFAPVGPGEAAVGGAIKVIKKVPGVGWATELSKTSQGQIASEGLGTAGAEAFDADAAAATSPLGVVPPAAAAPVQAAPTLAPTGNAPLAGTATAAAPTVQPGAVAAPQAAPATPQGVPGAPPPIIQPGQPLPAPGTVAPGGNYVWVAPGPSFPTGGWVRSLNGQPLATPPTIPNGPQPQPSVSGPSRNPYRVTEGNRVVGEFNTQGEMEAFVRGRQMDAPMSGAPMKNATQRVLETSLREHLVANGFTEYDVNVVDKLKDVLPERELQRLNGDADGVVALHDRTRKLISVAFDHEADNEYRGMGLSDMEIRKLRSTASVDHELMHAARDLGLFTEDEWTQLVDAARGMDIEHNGMDRVYREMLENPSADFTQYDFDGELVAHLYEDYRRGNLLASSPVAHLLEKFWTFLTTLGQTLKEQYPDAHRTLQAMERGEIGNRPRNGRVQPNPTPQNNPAAQTLQDLTLRAQDRSTIGTARGIDREAAIDRIIHEGGMDADIAEQLFDGSISPQQAILEQDSRLKSEGSAPVDFSIRSTPAMQTKMLGESKRPEPEKATLAHRSETVGFAPKWGMDIMEDAKYGEATAMKRINEPLMTPDKTTHLLPTLDETTGVITDPIQDIIAKNVAKHGMKSIPQIDTNALRAALNQDMKNILWFEDQAQTIGQAFDLDPEMMNMQINLIGATSGGALPDVNFGRGVSAMAEHLQGRPVYTPVWQGGPVRDAISKTHLTSPKYQSYANTFKYLLGMIDTPPGMVIDTHVLQMLGFPDDYTPGPKMYTALSDVLADVRDLVNRGADTPLENWQFQSALWTYNRGGIGTSFADYLAVKKPELKHLGVKLTDDGRITPETLMAKNTILAFGQTAEKIPTLPWGHISMATSRSPSMQTSHALLANASPAAQSAFRTMVQNPLTKAMNKVVLPDLLSIIQGKKVSNRAIESGVRVVGDSISHTMTVPLGTASKGTDFGFLAAGIAHTLNLDEVRLSRTDVEFDYSRPITPESLKATNRSATFEMYLENAADAEGLSQQLHDRMGIPVIGTRTKSGGVYLRLDTEPGDIVNGQKVYDAMSTIAPDEMVDIYPIISELWVRTPEDFPAEKARQTTNARDLTSPGNAKADIDRGGRIYSYLDAFEERTAPVRHELDANADRWNAKYGDEIDTVSAADPEIAHIFQEAADERIAQQLKFDYSIRSVHNAVASSPEGLRRQIDGDVTEESIVRRGAIVSKPAHDMLSAPVDGMLKFRDGGTFRGGTGWDAVDRLQMDIRDWSSGLRADGTLEPWAQRQPKYQALDKRFRPIADVLGTNLDELRPTAGNQAASAPRALALDAFGKEVWLDATARARPNKVASTVPGAAWDQYTNGIRQGMLFNWLNVGRYFLQNLTGNIPNIAMRGGGIPVVRDFLTDFREMRDIQISQRDPTHKTFWDMIEQEVGVGPRQNVKQNPRAFYDQMSGKTLNNTLIGKLTNAGGKLIAPDFLKYFGSIPDINSRSKVATHAVFDGFEDLNKRLVPAISGYLRGQGITGISDAKIAAVTRDFLLEKRTKINPNTGSTYKTILGKEARYTPIYNAASIRDYMFTRLKEDIPAGTLDMPAYERAIDRLYRDVVPETRRIMDEASDKTDHALFDWRNTNGDELISRAVLFHFWSSRQGGMYITEAMRHPWMIGTYSRMVTQMREDAEAQGLPDWMVGFFQFANTPAGYITWHSPTDWLQSLLTFADWQYGADPAAGRDLTKLGQITGAIPFFVHPGLQFGAYELGLLGPDYPAPPLLGVETFGSKAINFLQIANANSAAFMEPFNAMGIGVDAQGNKTPIPAKPLQELYAHWGNAISSALAPITKLKPVDVVPTTTTIDRNITTIIEQNTRLNNPDMSQFEVQNHVTDVLMDHSDPEYMDAYGKAAEMPLTVGDLPMPLSAAVATVSPIRTMAMPEQRAIDQMGFEPTGALPPRQINQNDPQATFLAQNAKFGATKTVEGQLLSNWNMEYYGLVDPQVKEGFGVYDIWGCNAEKGICKLTGPVTAGGVTKSPEEVAGMTGSERSAFGKQFLADRNLTEEDISSAQNAQNEYLANHPDYAAYQEYTRKIDQHPGGAAGFVAETAANNPSFAQFVRGEMTDYATGQIDYDRTDDPDAYLAAIGQRGSIYSPTVGNDPSLVQGGYPSIAGIDAGTPILPVTKVTAVTPLFASPSDRDQGYYDDAPLVANIDPSAPLQVIDRRTGKEDGMVMVQMGEYVGFVDGGMLQNVSPSRPMVPMREAQDQMMGAQPTGGLVGLAGGAVNMLGAAKDAVGNAVASLTGHNSGAPEKPTGFIPGYTDLVAANDGLGVQSTVASDRTWMEEMMDGHAAVTTDYKGPAPIGVDYSYQLGHGSSNAVHAAYDISCDDPMGNCVGTPISAPIAGTVTCAGYGQGQSTMPGATCNYSLNTTLPGQAHTIVLDVGTDPNGNSIQLSFNHMGTSNVTYGQQVTPGTLLGGMGNTDAGPHVHLEGWGYSPTLGTYRILDPQLIVSGWYQTHSVDGEVMTPAA